MGRVATLPVDRILHNLQEYQFLTPSQLASLENTSLRTAQRNLNRLTLAGKCHRTPYAAPLADAQSRTNFLTATYVYHLVEHHSRHTIYHDLDITDFHIRLQHLCAEHKLILIWQQKHMTGKFYPDAYFCLTYPDGTTLHFFLEVERQNYGNVRNGKPSIIRKADSYYEYYDSKECADRWGFNKFRVIFQLKEIDPTDFLNRIEHKHRMYLVGTPDSLTYQTNKGDTLTFIDL